MLDALRFPGLFDTQAGAYKDWFHVNLFDHASGAVGLLNVSLHGAPEDERSRAGGAALLHLPGTGWLGNTEMTGLAEARIGLSSLSLAGMAIALPGAGLLLASAHLPDDGLDLRLTAAARTLPLDVERQVPFGSGWISWRVLPRLAVVEGSLRAGAHTLDLAAASVYHDHNWGRWHWGDDAGWVWGAFLAPAPGPCFVVSQVSDRSHRHFGASHLTVDAGGTRRTFRGPAVEVAGDGALDARLRRLPGALAALHQDRRSPRLPARVRVSAGDGFDRVALDFRPRAAAQLIAADPVVPGYGFLHEMVGEFTATGHVGGTELGCAGLAVFEYVD
jgi:hypothetical protein